MSLLEDGNPSEGGRRNTPFSRDGNTDPLFNQQSRQASPRSGWQQLGIAASSPALSATRPIQGGGLAKLLSSCANPDCTSGWLHLWRNRSVPVFEGGWSCSAICTTARMEAAVRREMEGHLGGPPSHRHRVPLGLVMLEQGWVTSEQLRQALDAQKSAGHGKLGKWLMCQHGISEHLVTRALSLQWNCPVLPLDYHNVENMSLVMPRLFVEAFGVLPLRVAAGKILYLGFEERLDPVVALSAERMIGLRVEAGLVRGSLFHAAHKRMLDATFPRIELIETASVAPMARVLARAVERVKPVESRLVRMHDCLWLRMWLKPQTTPLSETSGVEDVVCSFTSS